MCSMLLLASCFSCSVAAEDKADAISHMNTIVNSTKGDPVLFPVQRKNKHCNWLLGHIKRKASSLYCGKLARHFLLTWFLVFGIISYDIS
ncbi:hypothetical protein LOK49_LG08G00729 [Camellia lanceoleosa]|uniref:Uncharacterized protein n=1 Tax=Camellia lanceoleosa TaxID=1840588 RepID=A0ACC0GTQ6_9ERIC|nr:hypothetical protein LOK49_LG08G00729 [Camellia lanceoleosa]